MARPAPPPAPRPSPLPALEHVALTIYGAADAAVREPGSPGAAATKAGSGAGAAAASRPSVRRLLSVPAHTRVERAKGGSGNQALPSRSGAFTCAQVYAGEGNLINAPPLGYAQTPYALASYNQGGSPRVRGTQGLSPASPPLTPD